MVRICWAIMRCCHGWRQWPAPRRSPCCSGEHRPFLPCLLSWRQLPIRGGGGFSTLCFVSKPPLTAQFQWIPEWGSAQLNWTVMSTAFWLRNPGRAFYLMLLIGAAAVPVALLRRQFGAAALV